MKSTEALRQRYAEAITRHLDGPVDRVRQAFATVPREAFLPPPPWTVISTGVARTSTDLADIYADNLVALDRSKGINNGEPALHAAWLTAVNPQPGEAALHVGAGLGYYTALLATLVSPDGRVEAFEVEEHLAEQARHNLAGYPGVRLHFGSALRRPLPEADIVYVNAGVLAPDREWLRALRPHGRLIFPWQPVESWGPAVLVTRRGNAFSVRALMNVGFITCSGQGGPQVAAMTEAGIASTRSIWLNEHRPPDESATLICDEVWFSSDAIV